MESGEVSRISAKLMVDDHPSFCVVDSTPVNAEFRISAAIDLMIYILEDNEDRVRRFRAVATAVAPGMPVRIWRSAPEMIADLVDGLEHAKIISLDHDLVPLANDSSDPGTGYDVAKLLEELIPCCPIIIHTSNSERGTWMQGALSRAGWTYDRVFPFGDDWIEKQWAEVLRQRLTK